MYNVSTSKSATKGNELGVFEGLNDVYSQGDLDLFFSTLARYKLRSPTFTRRV